MAHVLMNLGACYTINRLLSCLLSPVERTNGKSGGPKCGLGAECDADKDAAFFELLQQEVVKVNRWAILLSSAE